MADVTIGSGSHAASFYHPLVGTLTTLTGMDSISWGYGLNTANFPTYGGEVVQILSCYVDDLQIQGTLQTYMDMEQLYTYFLKYLKLASGGGARNEVPMKFTYPHRGWEFKIIVTDVPGYRKARELTAPEWRITAHVVDEGNDVQALKDLIITEAQIKTETSDPGSNFGLEGKIRFIDENPFSDPNTGSGLDFSKDRYKTTDAIGDYYSKLLPQYLNGDFDAIFNGIGSKPAFNPNVGPKGISDGDQATRDAIQTVSKK